MEPSNYAAWNVPLHRWDSVAAFTDASDWFDGIHIVQLPNGNHLDVLLQSRPLDPRRRDSIAVFFSGALSNRAGKLGPYFSGARVAKSLDIPFIAFSDPSLNLDGDIPLGWYAGSQSDNAQDAISEILKSATEKSERHLLLIGGSGGGFASLYFAHRVGRKASAFVWNPQTSIVDYDINAVRMYLDVAVPGNGFNLADQQGKEATVGKLAENGIDSLLRRSDAGRVLYLQNSTDWHVSKHLEPYLERNEYTYRGNGFYSNPDGHSVVISDFGTGHAAPPTEIIHEAVRQMLSPARSTRVIFNELCESSLLSRAFHVLPRDMRAEWGSTAAPPTIDVRDVAGRVEASVNWGQHRPGVGGMKVAFNVFTAGSRTQTVQLSSEYSIILDSPEHADRVEAIFVDGFGHRLGTVSAPVHQRSEPTLAGSGTGEAGLRPLNGPQAVSAATGIAASDSRVSKEKPGPRIFVYGSCVSRDVFEEPDAPVLVDYIARSSIGSAFSNRTGLSAAVSLEANPSRFQRRMVSTDLNKDLEALISSSEFDYLLVDFIDERLHLIRSEEGYDTYSPELSRAGYNASQESLVEPGSDEYMAAFRAGWAKLLDLVPAEKIIINRVFWASYDESGQELVEFPEILRSNEILARLYNHACAVPGVQAIDYSCEEARADRSHKWGVSPFHFSNVFYRKTVSILAALPDAPRNVAAVDRGSLAGSHGNTAP